jgi:hypothetical protein
MPLFLGGLGPFQPWGFLKHAWASFPSTSVPRTFWSCVLPVPLQVSSELLGTRGPAFKPQYHQKKKKPYYDMTIFWKMSSIRHSKLDSFSEIEPATGHLFFDHSSGVEGLVALLWKPS